MASALASMSNVSSALSITLLAVLEDMHNPVEDDDGEYGLDAAGKDTPQTSPDPADKSIL